MRENVCAVLWREVEGRWRGFGQAAPPGHVGAQVRDDLPRLLQADRRQWQVRLLVHDDDTVPEDLLSARTTSATIPYLN